MEKLTLKLNQGGFTDHTEAGFDFSRDDFPLVITQADTFLVGYRKPFNFFYNEFKVANVNANNLIIQYLNSDTDTLTDVPNLHDGTLGYTRSGFITFNRPEDDQANTTWKKSTFDGVELYWLVITVSADHSAGTEVRGMNVLYSDDNDLIQERSNIVSKHATNEPTLSWVVKHQAARNEIVQKLRNQGKNKVIKSTEVNPSRFADLTYFDILNLDQIRNASKFYTLAKIFKQELSDAAEDKWWKLGEDFEEQGDNSFDLFLLSLDTDDDGEEDIEENTKDEKRINLSFT